MTSPVLQALRTGNWKCTLRIASAAPPIPTLQVGSGEGTRGCRPGSENRLYVPIQGAELLPSAEPEHPSVSLQGDATGLEATCQQLWRWCRHGKPWATNAGRALGKKEWLGLVLGFWKIVSCPKMVWLGSWNYVIRRDFSFLSSARLIFTITLVHGVYADTQF